MSAANLDLVVLGAALVVLSALLVLRLSHRIGMPTLLLYLLIGLLLGESGLGVPFENVDLTQVIGNLMLVLILFEGGITTKVSEIRPVVGLATALASIGVLITIGITAGLAYLTFDVDARTAVLLGAVVASTDAAATFAVLRRLPIRPRLRATLEAESGFNDPPVIILATVVASEAWFSASPLGLGVNVVWQLVGGALVGLLVALAGRWFLPRAALPTAGLYPLAVLSLALCAFAVAGMVAASGILASYVAGLVLGNSRVPHRQATLSFTEGVANLAQIVLFVMLGLLASPGRLPGAVWMALVLGAVLTFVARPIAVTLCATPFRVPFREQVFISWAGLRGAVPIVVATIPMANNLESSETIFDVVFLLVVIYTLVQGPSLPWVAKKAGVLAERSSREIDVDSAPLEEAGAQLIQVTLPPESRMHGVSVQELRLPRSAVVSLVLRDGKTLRAAGHTTLRRGDHLLIAVADEDYEPTEKRLSAVSRRGRLAGWLS